MKLSEAQANVVTNLDFGEETELYERSGFFAGVFLVVRGEVSRVNRRTFETLQKRDIIKEVRRKGFEHYYGLTELGKKVASELA